MRLITGCFALFAAASPALAYDIEQWPTKTTLSDGTELALTGNFAWDTVDFSGDPRLVDDEGMRRREFGATVKKAGIWDAMVYFDFESKAWLDVFVRLDSKHFLGTDVGKLRVGYIKVPVGLEGVTSSRAGTFMELAAPIQAIYQGRRTGAEWTLERPRGLVQVGGYGGQDLQGDNPGQTWAARGVWTPRKAAGDVLHLGLALSQEHPQGWTDGRGVDFAPTARLRARPGAGLTPVRLIDSGSLAPVDHIRRTGLEGIWIQGPVSLQGELLRADIAREGGRPDYSADGGYLAASWLLTGESRPYSAGNVANPKPANGYGAVEVAARYSTLDLDDGPVRGGRQHDWTFGANWYLTSHFKLQANYVRVNATRNGATTRPDAVELRAQVQF
ncbi:porin [Luteimonas sp. 3794]|uniref:OprO/OprP family phosphate-selective porin n=1 Tax=Luteimonas sp. 3794 TaxID=2817730 RepID=UPI002858502D|nr:porin [Luteimonas sp. 3794]MDR6990475.1 phosphate-selective porin OprO/OprP [Luteimonas sp. 3794]